MAKQKKHYLKDGKTLSAYGKTPKARRIRAKLRRAAQKRKRDKDGNFK